MRIFTVLLFTGALLFPAAVFAEDTALPQLRFSAEMRAGHLELTVTVPDGHYTYRQSPYSVPFKVTASAPGVSFGQAVLPAGTPKDGEVVFFGSFKVKMPVEGGISAAAGSRLSVKLRVTYQLCEAARGLCLAPQEKSVTVAVTVPADSGPDDDGDSLLPPDDDGAAVDGDDARYAGIQSGSTVGVTGDALQTGIRPLSHTRKHISVENRVRIILKGTPGSIVSCSVYYWKEGKWQYLASPWKQDWQRKNGNIVLDLAFPEAGEYRVSLSGRAAKLKKYHRLFSYLVKASSGMDKWDLPLRPGDKFKDDGFRIVSHHKAYIRAGKKLRITVKGKQDSWLYVYLVDRRNNSYKYLYSPWEKSSNDGKGTYHFDLLFPGTGSYQLAVRGRPSFKGKENTHYFSYRIECTDAYSTADMPVQLSGAFTSLGFSMQGLSHQKYRFNAGSSAMVTLRGKPGVELKAYFSVKKPWKLYEYAPRVFVMPRDGVYKVWFWFPEAGTYNLGIKAEVTKKSDKYRRWDAIAQYEVTASGGYDDKSLDIRMGYYYDGKSYTKKSTAAKQKPAWGSAGELLWVTDMAEAERISRQQNRILMILHSATWCGFCKKLRNETFRHPDVVNYAKNRIVAIEVGNKPVQNMAIYESRYKKYRGGIPSVTFISPQGKKLITRTGYSAGKWYVGVLKNVVAMGSGLVDQYLQYHKQGNTEFSFKLIELYRSLGQKYKAAGIIKELLAADRIPENKKPKYYFEVAGASWGTTAEEYYRKIIDGYGPGIGYYWYYAVYKLAIHYYGGGYGGSDAKTLNDNERRSVAFITPYIDRSDLSLMWRAWYAGLIPGIRKYSQQIREKKGWSVDAQAGSSPLDKGSPQNYSVKP